MERVVLGTMSKGNEPAYPVNEEETDRIDAGIKIYSGLSKREYFAAMAMQGLCSDAAIDATYEAYADMAVKSADALIAALDTDRSDQWVMQKSASGGRKAS